MLSVVSVVSVRRTPAPRRRFYAFDRRDSEVREMRAKHQKDLDDCKVLIADLQRDVTAADTAAAAITAHLAKLEAKLADAARDSASPRRDASVSGDFSKTAALSRLIKKLETRRQDILAAVSETDPGYAIDMARHSMVLAARRVCMLSAMLL
jgi:predicted  nucleic acid-binding Zn-ribbon protein